MILQEIRGREGEKSIIKQYLLMLLIVEEGNNQLFTELSFCFTNQFRFSALYGSIERFEEDKLVNIPNLVQFY